MVSRTVSMATLPTRPVPVRVPVKASLTVVAIRPNFAIIAFFRRHIRRASASALWLVIRYTVSATTTRDSGCGNRSIPIK